MFQSKINAAFLIQPEPDTEVSAAIKEALELRKSFKSAVLLEFNGATVRVEKDSTDESVYKALFRLLNNRSSW